MKKVLLIGGAGFIGFNIAKYLSKNRNYVLTIADNFFRGKMDVDFKSFVSDYNIKIINADFTDSKSFDLLDSDYDYVYFLAAVVGVKYTEEIPNELIRINSFLTLNTLEWLKNSNCKKVLFTLIPFTVFSSITISSTFELKINSTPCRLASSNN